MAFPRPHVFPAHVALWRRGVEESETSSWTPYRPPPGLGPRCLPSLELMLPSWGGMVELFPLAPSWLALSKLEISQEDQIPSPHSYSRMRALRLREGSLPIALLPTSYHLQILGPGEHGCFLPGGQPLLCGETSVNSLTSLGSLILKQEEECQPCPPGCVLIERQQWLEGCFEKWRSHAEGWAV